jgi:D-alanine-D-alanine ligase
MPLELIAPPDTSGARFLSGAIKKADTEHYLEVTDIPLGTTICTLALDAFHALGAQDYGRIDVRLDSAGKPHFLEANLLPSLLDGYGNFPKACLLNAGLSHKAIILRIVDLALLRHEQATRPPLVAKARQNAGATLALLS